MVTGLMRSYKWEIMPHQDIKPEYGRTFERRNYRTYSLAVAFLSNRIFIAVNLVCKVLCYSYKTAVSLETVCSGCYFEIKHLKERRITP